MNGYVGMPGPGGSLGQCALCGTSFMKEILLGESVPTIEVDGCNQTLCVHRDCLKKYGEDIELSRLPEESPLRQAYEAATSNGEQGVV